MRGYQLFAWWAKSAEQRAGLGLIGAAQAQESRPPEPPVAAGQPGGPLIPGEQTPRPAAFAWSPSILVWLGIGVVIVVVWVMRRRRRGD